MERGGGWHWRIHRSLPFSSPPRELRLFWKLLVPRPSARMLGQWEGYGGAPSPWGCCRRVSGSDEGCRTAWATILHLWSPVQGCAVWWSFYLFVLI